MTLELVVLAAAGGVIAFANGANDVSKGVATLVGSGVTGYRRAILWGTFCTGLGGLAGATLAGAMMGTFGKGLLAPGTTPVFGAALAVVIGAGAWVLFATRTGLPVSTTHALVGAVTGVGVAAYGVAGVNWAGVARKLALPLALGPFVALAATMVLLAVARRLAGRGAAIPDCLCADVCADLASCPPVPGAAAAAVAAVAAAPVVRLTVAPSAACAVHQPAAARVTLGHLHWLTSGATSFARGLNDAPKMVALLLGGAVVAGGAPGAGAVFVLVAAAMVAGSLLAGRRVTRVLAEDVTRMDHAEGFLANLVTATCVGLGALKGMPLSTTHVASGAIVGVGLARGAGAIDWRTLRGILLAWLITLPAAAALAVTAFAVLRWCGV